MRPDSISKQVSALRNASYRTFVSLLSSFEKILQVAKVNRALGASPLFISALVDRLQHNYPDAIVRREEGTSRRGGSFAMDLGYSQSTLRFDITGWCGEEGTQSPSSRPRCPPCVVPISQAQPSPSSPLHLQARRGSQGKSPTPFPETPFEALPSEHPSLNWQQPANWRASSSAPVLPDRCLHLTRPSASHLQVLLAQHSLYSVVQTIATQDRAVLVVEMANNLLRAFSSNALF